MSNFFEKHAQFKLDRNGKPRSIIYPSLIIPFPEGQFTIPFNALSEEIEKTYPGYQFVNWEFSQYRIPGLSIPQGSEPKPPTSDTAIVSALFCTPAIGAWIIGS